MKNKVSVLISAVILTSTIFTLTGCGNEPKVVVTEEETSKKSSSSTIVSEDNPESVVVGQSENAASENSGSSSRTSNAASKENSTASKENSTASGSVSSSVNSTPNSNATDVKVGEATSIDDMDIADKRTLNKFYFAGAWSSTSDTSYYGGSNHWIWQPNAFYEVMFDGVQFEIISDFYTHCGIFALYIDDKYICDVDQYGPGWEKQRVIYKSDILSPGVHTFKVVNTGKQNEKCLAREAGRSCLAVDRVIVYAAG